METGMSYHHKFLVGLGLVSWFPSWTVAEDLAVIPSSNVAVEKVAANSTASPVGFISAIREPVELASLNHVQPATSSPSDQIVAPAPNPLDNSTARNQEPIQLLPIQTPNTNIASVGTGILPDDVTVGRLPDPVFLPSGLTRDGDWSLRAKNWVPGGFCHQPLYFEEPMLERHGHERFPHLQPVVSGLRFFGTFPVMPYLVTLHHPLDEIHTLGAYRPGSPAPCLRYRPHYEPLFHD